MFSYQLLFLLIFTVVLAGIRLFFFKRNQELRKAHLQKVQLFNQSISLHKTQMRCREKGLLQYHYLEYNLDESLLVQSEIKPI